MTEQDTRDLIAQAQAGSSQAEARLLQAHVGLVRRIARRFCRGQGSLPYADLMQEGRIGLLMAVRQFDLTRLSSTGAPIKFAWFANRAIINHIKAGTTRQPPWEQLPADRPEPLSPDPRLDGLELEPYLEQLPQLQRCILSLSYGLEDGIERTQDEAADMLGISRSHLCVQKRHALATLRGLLAPDQAPVVSADELEACPEADLVEACY